MRHLGHSSLNTEQIMNDCVVAVDLVTLMEAPDVLAIRQTIAAIRPWLDNDSDSFRAAVLLLVGPALGFNIDRMAGRTRCPRLFVAVSTRRLFDNGVWEHDGGVYAWSSPDDDRFWNDVEVATGRLCRRRGPRGEIQWAAPGEWNKRYYYTSDDNNALAITYICDTEGAAKELLVPSIEQLPTPRSTRKNSMAVGKPADRLSVHPPLAAAEQVTNINPLVNHGATSSEVQLFPDAQWL
jgi:hypothetical protein